MWVMLKKPRIKELMWYIAVNIFLWYARIWAFSWQSPERKYRLEGEATFKHKVNPICFFLVLFPIKSTDIELHGFDLWWKEAENRNGYYVTALGVGEAVAEAGTPRMSFDITLRMRSNVKEKTTYFECHDCLGNLYGPMAEGSRWTVYKFDAPFICLLISPFLYGHSVFKVWKKGPLEPVCLGRTRNMEISCGAATVAFLSPYDHFRKLQERNSRWIACITTKWWYAVALLVKDQELPIQISLTASRLFRIRTSCICQKTWT